MKLKVKTSAISEEIINLKPLKVEAHNHNTLMAIIKAFVKQNPTLEILYNCAKVNRKRIDENTITPTKWTANIYTIDAKLLENLYVRQKARCFEISYNPLKPIVHKPKTQRVAKIVVEEPNVVISNSQVTTNSSLV